MTIASSPSLLECEAALSALEDASPEEQLRLAADLADCEAKLNRVQTRLRELPRLLRPKAQVARGILGFPVSNLRHDNR